MPKVSVCIPTYNYAKFLAAAIDSVLAQTFEDFELIVSDNASTDETPAVLDRYAAQPALRVYRNERNLGLFANFNRCLELARGEYVKFLCADDWLDPRYLAEAVTVMDDHPEATLLTAPGWLVDEAGERWGYATGGFGRTAVVPRAVAMGAQARYLNAIGMPSSVLMRRADAVGVGGFDAAYAPASDAHLWLRLLGRGDLGWLPAPRCHLRIHPSKEHDYGSDPAEAAFAIWEDLAADPSSGVTDELRRTALYAEAEAHLLYVVAHVLGGRADRARDLARVVRRHLPWRRVLPRFAARLPVLALGQAGRLFALRGARLVVYSPAPRIGPRLEHLA
ncbi:MAG: glycosyltransferase family 2 protein [Solirubrobacteraceae bacterium]